MGIEKQSTNLELSSRYVYFFSLNNVSKDKRALVNYIISI